MPNLLVLLTVATDPIAQAREGGLEVGLLERATGLAGHGLAVRFENTTPAVGDVCRDSTVLIDNISATAREILSVVLSISNSSPGNVEISWDGLDGATYVVMTNANLIVADWQQYMATNVSAEGSVNITIPAIEAQLFYRVITQ